MDSNQLRVFVVDDETAFSIVIKSVLSSLSGFEVDTAETGEEALEKLKRSKYDVVLLDYRMPGISGLNVLQWMNEQKLETPVIMMTAAGTEEVAVEAMKLGAYDYVRKEHFDIHHLPILINGVYERYLFKKERELREKQEREREKQTAAMEMFQTTVRTVAHYVNNALTVLSLRSQVYEREARKNLDSEKAEKFVNLLSTIRQQTKLIEAVVKALVDVSSVVYSKYVGDQEIIDIQTELQKNLALLQEQEKQSVKS